MEPVDEVVLVLPREPAPVRLINTIWADRAGVHDELRSCRGARESLVAAGLLHVDVPVHDDDRAAVQEVRDAIRRLAEMVTEDVRPAVVSAHEDEEGALRVVNRAAAASPPVAALRLRCDELLRVAAGPALSLTASLGMVAAQAVDLLTQPGRLRACRAPGCVLYFVQDHPRREWCSTTCGNRARAARHYRRHHPPAGTSPQKAMTPDRL